MLLINTWCISLVAFMRQTMLLCNGALVILKAWISLNVRAMNTVILYDNLLSRSVCDKCRLQFQ